MDKYSLICALGIATVGAVKDVLGRRIPNWLTYSGIMTTLVTRVTLTGWLGRGGLAGMLLAGGIFCLVFLLGGMGGGGVKLVGAVGAWAGTVQVATVLIVAALAGVLAVGYMVLHRQVYEPLLHTVELARHHLTAGYEEHPVLNVRQPGTLRPPYELAVAMYVLAMRSGGGDLRVCEGF